MKRPSLPKLAARHFVFWSVDMAMGVCGWLFGFGLQVQNWPALLFFMFFSRWACFVIFGAADLARRQKEQES